jgi:hypothetical protein
MLTTRVMPEETTHPKPAIIPRTSNTSQLESGETIPYVKRTGNIHTLIERVFMTDAVNSKNEEWDHKQEA